MEGGRGKEGKTKEGGKKGRGWREVVGWEGGREGGRKGEREGRGRGGREGRGGVGGRGGVTVIYTLIYKSWCTNKLCPFQYKSRPITYNPKVY